MDGTGLTASDVALLGNGNMGGMNGFFWVFALLILAGGGFGGFGNRGDYGQFATAASQQEILFNQHFNNLDNKMDRGFTSIGNGIADATFALNNTIVNGNNMVAGTVVNESRGIQDKLYDVKTAVHAEGEATRAMIQQNKIETLQGRINQLELQSAMCGVVRYPNAMTYDAGRSPFCNCGGCGCNY